MPVYLSRFAGCIVAVPSGGDVSLPVRGPWSIVQEVINVTHFSIWKQ